MGKEEATDKVIAENLHGLELDARCTQIAAFNLALTAWKFCGHYKELPEMNLACSGIAPKGKKEDWVKLVGKVADPVLKARMENGMRVLYDHFQLAPELGSLLDPSTIKSDVFTASFNELQPTLLKALENESDKDQLERGVIAAGIAKAGQLLTNKYYLQITNVPYLLKRKQSESIKKYCELHFPLAQNDLATCFIERIFSNFHKGAIGSLVVPQNWTFQKVDKKFRVSLLRNADWKLFARLGTGAFKTISGEVVNVGLFIFSNNKISKNGKLSLLDASISNYSDKEKSLLKSNISIRILTQIEKAPDSRLLFDDSFSEKLIEDYSSSLQGIVTGDDCKLKRNFWEYDSIKQGWRFIQGTVRKPQHFGGMESLVFWGKIGENIARPQGLKAHGKRGILINRMGDLNPSIYSGEAFDINVACLIPIKNDYLLPILAYSFDNEFKKVVRNLDQKLNVTNATIGKAGFDLNKWSNLSIQKYPNGVPRPYSDDTTQWIFHGHPIKAENPLQVSVARLLGYRWPAESDTEMELADEAKELIEAVKAFDTLTDDDGILCIPSVNGEMAASERLRSFLQAVYGREWNNQTIAQLLTKEGATKFDLEDWLRDEFFDQHCKLFQNRPFIWHIWDGRKDGFAALVNYHKLDKENLQRLIYTYLGDWIRQCEAKKKAGESGAEGLLSAALKLKEKLETILEGEKPYDIFIRWKPIEKQPIGWEPDLNDGVRLNIRPFIQADVLRKRPNIKWGIDRGKNPPGSPWGEIRDNDKHLSLAEKKAAR